MKLVHADLALLDNILTIKLKCQSPIDNSHLFLEKSFVLANNTLQVQLHPFVSIRYPDRFPLLLQSITI
jgi:hypothetical protein